METYRRQEKELINNKETLDKFNEVTTSVFKIRREITERESRGSAFPGREGKRLMQYQATQRKETKLDKEISGRNSKRDKERERERGSNEQKLELHSKSTK